MKQFITSIFIAIIAMLTLSSCHPERAQLEQNLRQELDGQPYRFVSFEQTEVVTLQQEIDILSYVLSFKVNEESRAVKIISEYADNHTGEPIEKNAREALDNAYANLYRYQNLYDDFYDYKQSVPKKNLNTITFRIYELVYELPDSTGAYDRYIYRGRFNSDGELVAVQKDRHSEWEKLPYKRFYSVPPYYEE